MEDKDVSVLRHPKKRHRSGKQTRDRLRRQTAAALAHGLLIPPKPSSDPLGLLATSNEEARFKTRKELYSNVRKLPMVFEPVSASWQRTKSVDMGLPLRRTLKDRVAKASCGAPKKVVPIARDGNCFFRALSVAVCGVEDYHEELRGKLTHFMATNEVVQRYLHVPIAEYLESKKLRTTGTWACDAELFSAALFLETDIFVFLNKNWVKFSGKGSTQAPPTPQGVYLINEGSHYEIVVSVN